MTYNIKLLDHILNIYLKSFAAFQVGIAQCAVQRDVCCWNRKKKRVEKGRENAGKVNSCLGLGLGMAKHVPSEKITDTVFQCLSCVLREIMVTMGQVEKSLAFPEGPGTTSGIRGYL